MTKFPKALIEGFKKHEIYEAIELAALEHAQKMANQSKAEIMNGNLAGAAFYTGRSEFYSTFEQIIKSLTDDAPSDSALPRTEPPNARATA